MINIENLKQLLGSDEEFIAILMDKFLQELPKDAAKLKTMVSEKDWKNVRAVSHKMLSSTKIFSFDELTSVLQQIEKNSENQIHLDQMNSLMTEFTKASNTIIDEMKLQREKMRVN